MWPCLFLYLVFIFMLVWNGIFNGQRTFWREDCFVFYQAKLAQNHVPENYSRNTKYFLKLFKKTWLSGWLSDERRIGALKPVAYRTNVALRHMAISTRMIILYWNSSEIYCRPYRFCSLLPGLILKLVLTYLDLWICRHVAPAQSGTEQGIPYTERVEFAVQHSS